MVLTASSGDARENRVRDRADTAAFWRTTYIGTDGGVEGVTSMPDVASPESAPLFPVAYLIELDPRSVLGQHFHRANQFQVFVRGDGRLGKHAVDSVFVHYANAYSAYGPIHAGDRGLHFFTLRDAWDPGARFLPDAVGELRAARGHPRQAYAGPASIAPDDDLRRATAVSGVSLLEPAADGLGAWRHRLPAHASSGGPEPRGGGGQFWLVLAGTLQRSHGGPLLPLSCAFVSSDDVPFVATAGPGGAEILCLQFARRP